MVADQDDLAARAKPVAIQPPGRDLPPDGGRAHLELGGRLLDGEPVRQAESHRLTPVHAARDPPDGSRSRPAAQASTSERA